MPPKAGNAVILCRPPCSTGGTQALVLPVTVPYSLEIIIGSRMGLGHKQVQRECFWGEKKQLPQLGWWKPIYIWQQHRGGISQVQSLNAVVWSPRSNPWVTKANKFLFFRLRRVLATYDQKRAALDCREMQTSLCCQGLCSINSAFFSGPSMTENIFQMRGETNMTLRYTCWVQ